MSSIRNIRLKIDFTPLGAFDIIAAKKIPREGPSCIDTFLFRPPVDDHDDCGQKMTLRSELMSADELQHVAVEGFGLLPVNRVRSLGKDDELGVWNMGELAAHDPGRALDVLIAGHE